jgi:hypothetical protein
MTTILKSQRLLAALACCTFAATTPAHGAPPANLAGAPGARAFLGNLGVAPVHGWYCPNIGRVHLLHQNLGTGATVRAFTGQVSDDVVGQPLHMGGTLAIDNAAFGDLGETNFSATC